MTEESSFWEDWPHYSAQNGKETSIQLDCPMRSQRCWSDLAKSCRRVHLEKSEEKRETADLLVCRMVRFHSVLGICDDFVFKYKLTLAAHCDTAWIIPFLSFPLSCLVLSSELINDAE